MLSMISIPVTALAVGLPAQRAIAQRFSALAPSRHVAPPHDFGRNRGAADIEGGPGVTDCDVNDPLQT